MDKGHKLPFPYRDAGEGTDERGREYIGTVTDEDESIEEMPANSKGSSYDLTEFRKLTDNRYNTYAGLDDIQIVEMNTDAVDEFDVYISRNGALDYRAEYTREIRGSDDIGYTYVYGIGRDNFAEEGSYRLSFYSRDRAGNEINNTCGINDSGISFIIDNTAPKVIIDGVEPGMVYDVGTREVSVVVTDNFMLSEAEFTLVNGDDDVLGSWDYMELAGEGGIMRISIPQYAEDLSLLYRVKDSAGNEMQTFRGEKAALNDFSVTTHRPVQSIGKPAQITFGRTIFVFMAVACAMYMAVLLLRRKRWKQNSVLTQV